jgi:hypothetical protein
MAQGIRVVSTCTTRYDQRGFTCDHQIIPNSLKQLGNAKVVPIDVPHPAAQIKQTLAALAITHGEPEFCN